MPNCTQCGENNPPGTTRCNKCGVTLGGQARIRADARRTGAASAVSTVVKIIVAAVVLALALPAYHFAGASYYRYRLNTVKEAALKACGGTDTHAATYQQSQVDNCMATDDNLTKAQADYTNFTKGDKP